MCYFSQKICFEIRPLVINHLLIVQPFTPPRERHTKKILVEA